MICTLDKQHIYHDENGSIVQGVTSVLREAGLIDATWFDEVSRDRGSLVHVACALYDRDDLDESSLEPMIEPYVRAWKKFRKETGFSPVGIEVLVSHPVYRYAGTLDVFGKMSGGDTWLLDRKTGTAREWSRLQTAAYLECLPKDEDIQRGVVELDATGNYRLIEHTDRNDIKIFLAALAVTNWKKNHGG